MTTVSHAQVRSLCSDWLRRGLESVQIESMSLLYNQRFRRLETYFRWTVSTERMNALSLLDVLTQVIASIETLFDVFIKKTPAKTLILKDMKVQYIWLNWNQYTHLHYFTYVTWNVSFLHCITAKKLPLYKTLLSFTEFRSLAYHCRPTIRIMPTLGQSYFIITEDLRLFQPIRCETGSNKRNKMYLLFIRLTHTINITNTLNSFINC
jgi:hypothetical protein